MQKVLMVLVAMVVLVAGCSRDPVEDDRAVTQQPSAATPSPRAYVVVVTDFYDQHEVVVCNGMRRNLNERSHGLTTSSGGFTYAIALPPIGGGKFMAAMLTPAGEGDGALLVTDAGDLIASDNIHLKKVGSGCCGTGLSCGRIWALL